MNVSQIQALMENIKDQFNRHLTDEGNVRDVLIKLKPGDRVFFRGNLGADDHGIGTFFGFRHQDGFRSPDTWGYHKGDGLIVKRDDKVDGGRLFFPFAGKGDSVLPLDELVRQVLET